MPIVRIPATQNQTFDEAFFLAERAGWNQAPTRYPLVEFIGALRNQLDPVLLAGVCRGLDDLHKKSPSARESIVIQFVRQTHVGRAGKEVSVAQLSKAAIDILLEPFFDAIAKILNHDEFDAFKEEMRRTVVRAS